jgi:hypothetical protein
MRSGPEYDAAAGNSPRARGNSRTGARPTVPVTVAFSPFRSRLGPLATGTVCAFVGVMRLSGWLPVVCVLASAIPSQPSSRPVRGVPETAADSLLDTHLMVTWYGNPHSRQMGVLGESEGAARAAALRRQADAFAPLTGKTILPAYHLVAVVAQQTPGSDGTWRRRESSAVIASLLADARSQGFALVLDVQPGRADIAAELAHLRPFLVEPDVHLALDPEFDMGEGQRPGRELGHMHASDINTAVATLATLVSERDLPPKVLIVHQFTLGMLPDKEKIRVQPRVDLVLDMDGFGSRSLKLASYRAVMRQFALRFAGFKLFYRQDTNLFAPADVMRLEPIPSVVIYQ